jgi:hypothetical protein
VKVERPTERTTFARGASDDNLSGVAASILEPEVPAGGIKLAPLDSVVRIADPRSGGTDRQKPMSWPAEIDVFLIVGELALYVAYLDAWERRYKLWPWVTAITGLGISVVGNVGHVQALPGSPVTLADRLTAATSPLAAFAGLMVGLLVLKMTREVAPARGPSGEVKVPPWLLPVDEPFADATQVDGASPVAGLPDPRSAKEDVPLLADAAEILGAARICGERVSQRAVAAQLRERGHRFSNAQLRGIAITADSVAERRAALCDAVRLQRMSSGPSPGLLLMVSTPV